MGRASKPGFSLVLSLAVMSLLVLVILSLAGFLTIESRVAAAGIAQRQARLNALASAREALGVLQQEMGPDQRISASAGLLDADPETPAINDGSAAGPLHHPNWVGSWNSYRPGLKRDSEYDTVGKGTAPLALRRLATAPSYEKAGVIGGDRTFRRWLVSTGYDAAWETANPNLALAAGLRTDNSAAESLKALRGAWLWNTASVTNAATLLGPATLGLPAATTAASAKAEAPLVPFPGTADATVSGRFAWWITDNSQRATVNLPPRPEPANTWERVQAVFSPERTRPEVPHGAGGAAPLALQAATPRTTAKDFATFGFDPALAAGAATFGDLGSAMTAAAATTDPSWRAFWLDYTTSSRGVLANPLNGDLKSDINLILENPSRVHPPSRHIDIAAASSNINPSVTGDWYNYALLDTIDEARNYLLYFHRQSADEGNALLGRIRPYRGASWTDLWRWYQSYRQEEGRSLSGLTPRRSVPVPISTHYDPHQGLDKYEMLDFPRFAKIQYVYSYTARQEGTLADGSPAYRLGIGFVPVITLWNPFNFRLEFPLPPSRGGVAPAIKCAGMPVGFHVGFRRWDAATGAHGGVTWVTPGSPNLPAQGQRWVHTSFFATQTWVSNYTQESPQQFLLNPGEARVYSPRLASDYVKTTGSNDGFAAYPGYEPANAIVNYGETIGTYDGILGNVTPVGTWAWTGGANDLVVIQPYYSDHTSNSAWANAETAVDFWTDNGWPVQEYRGAYTTSFKSAVEGASGQNTIKINYNPAKFRSVSLAAATGAKIPFLSMSMYLKSEQGTAAAGRQYPNLAFLHSSLLNRNQTLGSDQRDLLWLRNVGIEFYIDQLFGSWDSDAVQVDAGNRGFVGSGLTAENGARFWAGSEQPYWPVISLGLLQNAQMGNQGLGGWRTMGTWLSGGAIDFAFGNSAGYPGIPVDAVTNQGSESAAAWPSTPSMTGARFLVDHAYLANWSGWDYHFVSSLTRQDTPGFAAHGVTRRDFAQVLDEFLRGVAPLPNRRLTWIRNSGEADNSGAWARLMNTGSVPYVATGIPAGTTRQGDLAQTDAHGKLARNLLLEGAFNVNSVSKEAWRAVLLAARGRGVPFDRTSQGAPGEVGVDDLSAGTARTPFPRFSMPLGPCADKAGTEESYWSGFRALTDEQVDALAEEIVKEVKQRGPFLSLGEFVNRRVAPRASGNRDWFAKQAGRATGTLPDNRPETRGALQAAIDRTDINARFMAAGRTYTTAELTASDPSLPGMATNSPGNPARANFPADAAGKVARAYGANGFLTQADVLNVIGSFLSARGDTFTLRCLGESPRGDARATCEIVVQRLPEYVRHRDTAATNPNEGDAPETNWGLLKDPVNKSLGRRFRIVSFRWLAPNEI